VPGRSARPHRVEAGRIDTLPGVVEQVKLHREARLNTLIAECAANAAVSTQAHILDREREPVGGTRAGRGDLEHETCGEALNVDGNRVPDRSVLKVAAVGQLQRTAGDRGGVVPPLPVPAVSIV
jgi:hypothetical protein